MLEHPMPSFGYVLDCGGEELSRFLIRFAFPNQRDSQTYVGPVIHQFLVLVFNSIMPPLG